MSKFHVRGSYVHHTKITNILDHDQTFQVNMKALIGTRPNPETFAMVRNYLVRSAVARHRRVANQMAMARAGAEMIERELCAA